MKKYLPLITIFLLALLLRVYKLSELPSGFHADEVRVGWNAYSILKTGADDWGHKFPLYYNTFGDFRPTGYFYLTIPSILIFGLNEFAVRFPGALFGSLTVLVLYALTKELSGKKSLALLSALLLSLNPWHLSLSRATSEGVVAIFFALTGLWLLIRELKATKPRALLLLPALLLLLSSYFLYHSARLLVPLFAFTTIFYYWKFNSPRLPFRVTVPTEALRIRFPLLVACLLSLITILFTLDPAARSRLNQVSIFNDLDVRYELDKMPFEEGPGHVFEARLFHNKPVVYTRHFINQYTQYISAKFFLVPKEAKPARYMTVGMGILTYTEFFLLLAGLVALAQQHKKYTSKLVLILLLISPLPAAITTEDAPNLHRAAFMIPFLAVIEAYGFYFLVSVKTYGKKLKFLIPLLLILNSIFFLHMYFVHNRVDQPYSRNVGAKELGVTLNLLQSQYDKVLLTDIPDSPFPWIAYFGKFDPQAFNAEAQKRDKGVWGFGKYQFLTARCPSQDAFRNDNLPQKILVVDAEACETVAEARSFGPNVKIKEQIKRPDGTVVYTLWSRE